MDLEDTSRWKDFQSYFLPDVLKVTDSFQAFHLQQNREYAKKGEIPPGQARRPPEAREGFCPGYDYGREKYLGKCQIHFC